MSEPVKVVIEVRGGCVMVVKAGVDLDVCVLDWDDTEEAEDAGEVIEREFNDGTKVQDFLNAPSTVAQW